MERSSFLARFASAVAVLLLVASDSSFAQDETWRSAAGSGERYSSGGAGGGGDITPIQNAPPGAGAPAPAPAQAPAPQPPVGTRAVVSKGSGSLRNDAGQVWREYDIRPYTGRIATTERPQQAIIDWILRETGYEAWHSDPMGLLSANRETLSVYHTPEMQATVADIVDRFVNTTANAYAFTLRVATVRNPNWRAKALPMLTPIPVQSPGVQGWMLSKEDARLLVSELSRRTDYREYNSSAQLVNNGESMVISTMRPRSYVKGAVATQAAWPGYQPEMGTLEEGFALEFSPLMSFDLAAADAVVKLRLNQVEKMLPVKLDLPTVIAPNQRVQIDVPQMTMANLHERFRWPADRVLLLSMGVVAIPGPSKDNPITDAMTDALPIFKDPPRADAIVFVECAGRVAPAPEPIHTRAASVPQHSFQGRY